MAAEGEFFAKCFADFDGTFAICKGLEWQNATEANCNLRIDAG
jgi:hypothetical protein